MDPIRNPFSPGAGAPPPELVGRDGILQQSQVLLGRVKQRRPEKSMLLTGLRGVGKTVLLNEIERIAAATEYRTISIEAHENKPLAALLVPPLRKVLFDLDRVAGAGDKVRRGLRVLRSFIGAIRFSVDEFSFGLDIDPEIGAADSGDLEADLPNLFVAIGEAAEERHSALALFIDEIQYFGSKELGALIMAMHRIQQKQLPVVLIGAGLPILPALAGESKSYAERLFNFPQVGALSKTDAARALEEPAEEEGVSFQKRALDEIYRLTEGYPYFIQEWGYQAWNHAEGSPITLGVIEQTTPTVVARLDENFFRVRYDRLTPAERRFLRGMAELGPGPHRTGDVADVLQVKVTSVGPVRARLISKGMIFSPSYGDVAFTVPLFDEFIRRTMPKLELK